MYIPTYNYYSIIIIIRWLQVRLDLLGVIIVFSAALFAVLGRSIIGAALVGLSVTYALQVGIRVAPA